MQNPEIAALVNLDRLDAKALKLRRELSELPQALEKRKAAIKAAKARVQALHDEQKTLEKEIHGFELEVKTRAEGVKKLSLQQNTAKTNEEYATLTREIDALKKQSSELEDKQLARYERIDQIRVEEKQGKAGIEVEEANLRDEEATLAKERNEIEGELGEVAARRAAAEKAVTAANMALYKRILDKKGDKALASVQGRTCQGCFMEVPSNMIATLLKGGDIVTCKNCSRILYLMEDYRAVTPTSYTLNSDGEETSKDTW